MKQLICILVIFSSFLASSQTYSDIASLQGITFSQDAAINHGNGMSFFDFDEDGWDDLTFPSHSDSILFFRNVGSTLEKVTPSLYAPGQVRQVLWWDYDDDGDQDLLCTYYDNGIRLYNNDGTMNFTDVTLAVGLNDSEFQAYGASAADPDADGDLDLYISVYWTSTCPAQIPNQYYENQGNGTFIEKASVLNIDNGLASTFQSVWFDVNNDNHLDMHLINDRNPFYDELYINDGYNNYTASAIGMDIDNDGHFPMSVSVADYNNDGFQDVFKSDAANGTVWNGTPLDYKLYRNDAGASFTNVAPAMGLTHQAFGWGALWVDYNNDSYEDLFVSTGFTDTINNNTLSSVFFQNNQGTSFQDITDSVMADIVKTSYAAVKGDLDRNGFYDIVLLNDGDPSNVLLNSPNENTNNYVRITVFGTESNRMAIGSTIKVYANNTCQTQTIFCGSDLCSQHTQHKIFGIGASTSVDSVVVTFPNGNIAKRFDLAAGTDYVILEKTEAQVQIPTGFLYNDLCAGDTIQIGIPGLVNYQWNTGESTPYITVTSTGTYSFTAQNAVGDSLITAFDLTLTFHNNIPHQTIVTDALCGSGSLGSAQVSPLTPSIIDSIVWSNGTIGTTISGIVPGTYDYTIYSIYGCEEPGTVIINTQPLFSSQYITTPFTDQAGGSVQLFTWGGTPPFTYALNSVVVTDYIDNLNPGVYEVIITDSAGCSDTVGFVIENESTAHLANKLSGEVSISYSDDQLAICGVKHDGNYQVNVINDIGQIIFDWKEKEISDCQIKSVSFEHGWYIVVIHTDTNTYTQRIYVD